MWEQHTDPLSQDYHQLVGQMVMEILPSVLCVERGREWNEYNPGPEVMWVWPVAVECFLPVWVMAYSSRIWSSDITNLISEHSLVA